MICPYCNHEVPGEYRFCLQCGVELREDTIVQPGENTLVLPKTVASVRLDPTIAASLDPNRSIYDKSSQEQVSSPKTFDKRIWLIAMAIVLGIGAILIASNLGSSDQSPSSRSEQTVALATPTLARQPTIAPSALSAMQTPVASNTPLASPTASQAAVDTPTSDWQLVGAADNQTMYYRSNSINATSSDSCVVWAKLIPIDGIQERNDIIESRRKKGLDAVKYYRYSYSRVLLAFRCKTSEMRVAENVDIDMSEKIIGDDQPSTEVSDWKHVPSDSIIGKLMKSVCPTFCCEPGP